MHNRSSGLSHAELLELAAEAIVRQWTSKYFAVSIEQARAAVERCFAKQQLLGPELARAEAEAYLWPDDDYVIDLADIPHQRIDLTERRRLDLRTPAQPKIEG